MFCICNNYKVVYFSKIYKWILFSVIMKPIDFTKYPESLDAVINKLRSMEDYLIKAGPIEFTMPKKFIYSFFNQFKFVEAEDVKDILMNYSAISKLETPFTNEDIEELKNHVLKSLDVKKLSNDLNFIFELNSYLFQHTMVSDSLKTDNRNADSMLYNLSFVALDNIYLGDFNSTNNGFYERCEFTIRDSKYCSIDAMAILNAPLNDKAHNAVLVDAVSKARSYNDYSQSFDIVATALPMRRLYCDPMKLSVLAIQSHDEDKKKSLPIDINSVIHIF